KVVIRLCAVGKSLRRAAALGVEEPAEKREAVSCKRIRVRRERAPDGGCPGDGFHTIRKGFDDDLAAVVDVVQRRRDVHPRKMTRAGCPRSFSATCRWMSRSPASRNASAGLFSSIPR